MQAGTGSQAGMIFLDGQKEIPCQPTGIGSLFHQMEDRRAVQGLVEFIRLSGEKFAQDRSRGHRGEEITGSPGSGLAGGVKARSRVVQGFFHKAIERQEPPLADFGKQVFGKGLNQDSSILFGQGKGGEIDDCPPPFKFREVRRFLILGWLVSGSVFAQTANEGSLGLSDLPSAESQLKIPGLDGPAPTPDIGDMQPSDNNPSIPQIRPAEKDKDKAKEQDWAAQAMMQKQEEAKKKQQEEVALAEQKARESQEATAKEKKEKQEKSAQASKQPTVAGPSVSGFGEADAQKLPVVTGLDGVKPRAMASGDGRVQPAFDSFTGPSGTGPLGKDFQSGAKPIMAGNTTADGRMQVPQVPQPPSGAYKRISQDPYTLPAGYGEKKPVAPPPPKPVVIPPNPSTGDPKRAIDDSKAGYSPYDNTRKVPDPRSQRRF